MTASELLAELTAKGVTLTPNGEKLKLKAAQPVDELTLHLIRSHKPDLLRLLTGQTTIDCLPWQLERLVSAASSDNLAGMTYLAPGQFVPDLNRYVMAWACAYLTGERDEALARLWQAYRAWQGVN